MAMNDKALSKKMLSDLRSSIKGKYPKAVSTDYQKPITDAISKGTIVTIKTAKGFGDPGTPSLSGPDTLVGIFNLQAPLMTEIAISYVRQQIGSVGEALELIFSSVFGTIIEHLMIYTEVKSNGFSGQVEAIVGAEEELFFNNIYSELPSNLQIAMKQVNGEILIRAISKALASTTKTGQSLVFAGGSTPNGQLIASFM